MASQSPPARNGWSLLGVHIRVGFHIGAYSASIVLPIQAVYLETSDSHFQTNKWSSDKSLTPPLCRNFLILPVDRSSNRPKDTL